VKNLIATFALAFCTAYSSFAQGPLFTKNFTNLAGSMSPMSVDKTPYNDFVIFARCDDSTSANHRLLLMKVNMNGDILSQKAFTTIYNETYPQVKVNTDGTIIAIAYFSTGMILVKMDSSFNEIWSRKLPTIDHRFPNLMINQRGNYIVYGAEFLSLTGHDGYVLMEIDNNGDLLHEQLIEYLNTGNNSLVPYNDHYLFTCRPGPTSGANYTELDTALSPVSFATITINERPIYSSLSWNASRIYKNEIDSTTIHAGSTVNGGIRSLGLLKMNNTLQPSWLKKYYPPANVVIGANSIVYTSDNNYLISLYLNFDGAHGSDIGLMKIDTTGNLLWSYQYGDTNASHNETVYYSFEVPDGYVHFGTSTYMTMVNSTRLYQSWMMKTDFDGNTACDKYTFPLADTTKTMSVGGQSYSTRQDPQIVTTNLTVGSQTVSESTPCILLNSKTIDDELNVFELFPNPGSEQIEIKANHSFDNCKITVTEFTGHVIYSENLNSDGKRINTATLAAGMYLITLSNEQFKSTKKLFITH
jgi:hypothetical protein